MPCRVPTTWCWRSSLRVGNPGAAVASSGIPDVLKSLVPRLPAVSRLPLVSLIGRSPQKALHLRGRNRVERGGLVLEDLLGPVRAELGVLHLVVELEDRVDEHLRPR